MARHFLEDRVEVVSRQYTIGADGNLIPYEDEGEKWGYVEDRQYYLTTGLFTKSTKTKRKLIITIFIYILKVIE